MYNDSNNLGSLIQVQIIPKERTLKYVLDNYRGGEWSVQKYGSHKIFVKFLRSRSLNFCADCQRLGVSNFCKVVTKDLGLAF